MRKGDKIRKDRMVILENMISGKDRKISTLMTELTAVKRERDEALRALALAMNNSYPSFPEIPDYVSQAEEKGKNYLTQAKAQLDAEQGKEAQNDRP